MKLYKHIMWFCSTLTIFFIIFKVLGITDMYWWFVFLPILAPVAIVIIGFNIIVLSAFISASIEGDSEDINPQEESDRQESNKELEQLSLN